MVFTDVSSCERGVYVKRGEVQNRGESRDVEGAVAELVELPAQVRHLAVELAPGLLTLAQGVLTVLYEGLPDQEAKCYGAYQYESVLECSLYEKEANAQGGHKDCRHYEDYSCSLWFHCLSEPVPIMSSGAALSTIA